MKTIEIITLSNGYYVKCSQGANHSLTFCKTKKAAEALKKTLARG